MGKIGGEVVKEEGKKESGKEGDYLLGPPRLEEESGRFKCVETGHKLPAHARDSKQCRHLGLIDAALSNSKPPLNMFRQDPQPGIYSFNRGLLCFWLSLLLGLSIVFSLALIALVESPCVALGSLSLKDDGQKATKKSNVKDDGLKKKKKIREETGVEVISEARIVSEKDSELEEEDDFWMPPVGEHWDNDDGGDRQGSDPELGPENDDADGEGFPDKMIKG
nr:uncharacterized protein LOC113699718 [Coffea arabica]